MFKIIPVMQYQNTFSANLYFQGRNVGGIGKDKEGIYVNLNKRLNVSQMSELIKTINGINENFDKEELKFQYAEDFS